MLDIPRFRRIRLTKRPSVQILTGQGLTINYGFLPGVQVEFEDDERLPAERVIFAMNHTDRYNYFPFQHRLWKKHDRFTASWVKGKYYENALVGFFMEKTNQLPTVSRGYLISRDFASTVDRPPRTDEYTALRRWVDAVAMGGVAQPGPDCVDLPDALLSKPRDVLGYAFDPEKEDYPSYINAIYHIMMRRFVELNREAVKVGLDLLIFPQGTRSVRLLPGHIGISQIALHLKIPIVPIGCNGSDRCHPGASPWAKKGRIVYRFGHPIRYEDLAPFHVGEEYEPFSADAEQRHHVRFQGLADMLTDRIEELLDEPYRRGAPADADASGGSERFI